jgi:hypothetical protein
MKLLLPTFLILAQASAWADGGMVQLRQETGDLVVTVFTSPTPLSVGPADISLLLQKRNGLEPVLDADVSLLLVYAGSNIEFHVRPTREQARNKLLYAAPVMLSKPGRWGISVTVERKGKAVVAAGSLEVAPAPGRELSLAGFLAFPPIMIGLFVIRELLVRRRSWGGA